MRALFYLNKCLLAALLFIPSLSPANKLSSLAKEPHWAQLNAYQKTITHHDFLWLLEHVYAPNDAWKKTISVSQNQAIIQTQSGQKPFILHFAPTANNIKPIPRYWKSRSQLPKAPAQKPLAGLRIAIDPGHIGGTWAKTEERWFQIGNSRPVTEGDMTLLTAKLIAKKLQGLGAKVYLTRTRPAPVTPQRPDKLRAEALKSLQESGENLTSQAIQKESELLFYRVSEIRHRARLINEKIKPDLVICIHFNAEAWGNPNKPTLINKNHMHFLVTGTFSKDELDYDDQRFDMLKKLLDHTYSEEVAVTQAIAESMQRATKLPPYEYEGLNATRATNNPYIWTRNLLANRLFECPVVFAEPYVMNSRDVFTRIQAGDYIGKRRVNGSSRKSIYREYADAIVDGLVAYYKN